MFFQVSKSTRDQAKSPHELAMVNLLLCNLLMLIALLGGSFLEKDSTLAPYRVLGVAIAPMLIALMVLIMLESGARYQAQRGEVPDRLVQRLRPPTSTAQGGHGICLGHSTALIKRRHVPMRMRVRSPSFFPP